MIRFIENYVTLDRMPENDYEMVQLKFIRELPKNAIKIALIVFWSLTFMLVGPLYAYFFKNQYVLPTGVHLPFTDPSKGTGFLVNIILQSFISIVAIVASISLEILNVIVKTTLKLMTKLVIIEMAKLSDDVEKNGFRLEHALIMKDICTRLEDIENYVKEYNSYSYWRNLFQPSLTTYAVSLAILGQYLVSHFNSCNYSLFTTSFFIEWMGLWIWNGFLYVCTNNDFMLFRANGQGRCKKLIFN